MCTDSSKEIAGIVAYLYNNETNELNFLLARNRLVSKAWSNKSIPCKEMAAIVMGVEALTDNFQELTGESCVKPITITKLMLFTDSKVCLSWILNFSVKYSKMNKLSVFIRNRLTRINKLCEVNPVEFRFCAGDHNPADYMTRVVSSNQLAQSNFHTGISCSLIAEDSPDFPGIVVPDSSMGSEN